MKKIKDFFYNINDILVIILIVGLAGVICFWRMQIILDYSTAKTDVPDKKIDIDFSNIDLNPEEKIDPIIDPVNPDNPTEDQEVNEDWVTTKEVKFTITGGTYNEIIKSLSESFGLTKEESLDLYQLLFDKGVALGADTRIGTGEFTFKEGTTIEGIIRIIARMEEKKN